MDSIHREAINLLASADADNLQPRQLLIYRAIIKGNKSREFEYNLAIDLLQDGLGQQNPELTRWGVEELEKLFSEKD